MSQPKLRPAMSYGHTAPNGTVINNRGVDDYNRIQDEINTWIKAGRDVPEFLLDWSHRKFCEISGMQGM